MTRQFHLPTETFVRMLFNSGFLEGGTVIGSYLIEGLGVFDFEITNFGLPYSPATGGTFIKIIFQDGTVLSAFSVGGPDIPASDSEKFFKNSFIVALAGEAGRIPGIDPEEPAPFPLPRHLKPFFKLVD